ncbi:hypothetical protein Aglo03_13690 [Actinokineospora globicatena]|uniref:Uncharacterized protein n=1 Tax=Actinokineospora globicatena TaxID=103729 RepID=A0A9W6QLN0_9PSEU|nr:hypothetical protein Aglo03_13690 [Actinokineospora globicatena]
MGSGYTGPGDAPRDRVGAGVRGDALRNSGRSKAGATSATTRQRRDGGHVRGRRVLRKAAIGVKAAVRASSGGGVQAAEDLLRALRFGGQLGRRQFSRRRGLRQRGLPHD